MTYRSLLLSLMLLMPVPASAMSGDADAIAMARKMIENMGGRERWARAIVVYTREEGALALEKARDDLQLWQFPLEEHAETQVHALPLGNP